MYNKKKSSFNKGFLNKLKEKMNISLNIKNKEKNHIKNN